MSPVPFGGEPWADDPSELKKTRNGERSPVPFGGEPWADPVIPTDKLRELVGHQCLSAESRGRTALLDRTCGGTPHVTSAFRRRAVGGHRGVAPKEISENLVTSAFRRRAVGGRGNLTKHISFARKVTSAFRRRAVGGRRGNRRDRGPA